MKWLRFQRTVGLGCLCLISCGDRVHREFKKLDPTYNPSTSKRQPPPSTKSMPPYELTGNAEPFADCAELEKEVDELQAEGQAINRASQEWYAWKRSQRRYETESLSSKMAESASVNAASADSDLGAASPGSSNQEVGTNLQEQGIDEPDGIKMGRRHFFVTDNQSTTDTNIHVSLRNPLTPLGTIRLPALTNPNLYSIADQLIVTGFGSLLGKGGVWVRSYDTAGKQSQSESSEALPSASYEQFFRGSLLDSRMVAGRLILVLQDDAQKIDRNGQGPQNPVEPSCDSFIKTPFNQAQTSYTRIVILDTQSGNLLSEVSVPGALGNQIYVSKSQIVVAGNPAISPYWIRPDDRQTQKVTRDLRQRIGQKLQLVAIDYESSGEITAVALGTVAGRLKPFGAAWSLKTIENGDQRLLSVFTTTGSVRAEDNLGEADNHLYILAREGRELTEVANIPSIAKTEDIRSVRYEGDYAYVVTFKRTDPLFAISLKDPLAPVIEGELKIPGFSMYMHPTGEGQMVGLGYHTEEQKDRDGAFFQGIQLSAFDVSDPENMVRTDNLIMGMRGSYSEATQDHHAFYYDQSDHVLALPLTTFNDELGMINGEQNQSQEDSLYVDDQLANQARIHFRRQFSGAVFFRVGTQTFTELARVSHFSLLRGRCQNSFTPLFWTSQLPPQPDIRRVFKGDGKIYAISNYGIEQLAGDTFVSETIVKTGFGDCQRGGFQGGFE